MSTPDDPQPPTASTSAPDEEALPSIADFDAIPRRIGAVLLPVGGLSLLGAVVDGAVRGLTFALLGRWFGIFVVLGVLGMAVTTALHALGGAGRAGARGDRLSSPDVGLAPRQLGERSLRFPTGPPAEGDDEPDGAPDPPGPAADEDR